MDESMKAMEAPKKIYLTQLMLFATPTISSGDNDVEYTRTDAFIKMAVGRLKHYLDNSVWVANDVGVREKEVIIDDFKNYMKGE